MAICKRCIIPDSFPGIVFKDGVCNFCNEYDQSLKKEKKDKGEELTKILKSKSSPRKYNCVVPISGGKESTYILYYIVKILGLNALAVHFDNGFGSELSKQNIKNVCKTLSVDLVTDKTSVFRQKMVKEGLIISRLIHKFWWGVCDNCRNNFRTQAIREATNKNIPFIIWGDSTEEVVPKKAGIERVFKDYGEKQLHELLLEYFISFHIILYCRSPLDIIRTLVHKVQHDFYIVQDNLFNKSFKGWKKYFPGSEVSLEKQNKRSVFFFDYVSYDPVKHIDVLKKEVRWQAPKDKENKMDCTLHCLGNAASLISTGITGDGFYYADLVRKGFLTREEALRKEGEAKKGLCKECRKQFKSMNLPFLDE